MNDEQISAAEEQIRAPQVDTNLSAVQIQLSELATFAQSALDNIKASEKEANDTLIHIRNILTNAKQAIEQITEAPPKFAAAATEIEVNKSAATANAQQIEQAQQRAMQVRGELDAILISVKQTQAETDALKQSTEIAKASAAQADADSRQSAATAKALAEQVGADTQKTKTEVDANAEAVAAALAASSEAFAKTKRLADKAESTEQRIQAYEDKLSILSAQCEKQLEAIKSLLPGATSAGLASAFDQRRQTFLKPSSRWQGIFVASVVILAVLALIGLGEAYFHASELSYQQLLVRWLSRIPFAAALVWLAMHASRESALAKRLEEDYGFKASVASSFQGFQEQMKIVGGAAAGNEPLKTLCDATLAQITNPPGRIYEKHSLAVSPTAELLKAAQAIVDSAKVTKGSIGE